MDDDNLYTGKLNDFTAKGSDVSTISLVNIFRYYPDLKLDSTTNQRTPDGAGFKSNRKQRLVNNGGELLIPFSKVKTAHIWTIVKGTIVRINVF